LPVSGACPDEFLAVRDAFLANFADRGKVGGAVCVMIDGGVVIDLVGGWRDSARTQPWRDDTLVDICSAGKGVLAALALHLNENGQLALDARVVYHTNTYGHLVGEIIRRAGGQTVSAALREPATSLTADVWIGVPPEEQSRCAEVIFESPPALSASVAQAMGSEDEAQRMIVLAYLNPPGYGSAGVVNTPEWRGAQVPAANAHATAKGLAQIYGAQLVPNRQVSSELLAEATKVQAAGDCPILGEYVEYGLGFVPTSARRPMGANPRAFGHFGTGGAVGFGDPDAGVAFGYALNHVGPRWQSSRNRALIDSLYDCLHKSG